MLEGLFVAPPGSRIVHVETPHGTDRRCRPVALVLYATPNGDGTERAHLLKIELPRAAWRWKPAGWRRP